MLSSFFFFFRGAAPPENNQAQLEQSLRELRILNSCRHDNILPLFGFSVGGDEPCLVYQFMPNGSLEDRLLCRVIIVISIMYQNWNYFVECFVLIKLFGWQDEEITFGRYTPVVFMFSRCVLCSDADVNGIVVCLLQIEICSCKVSQPLLFC
jgi:hypothetical protein